MPDLGQLQYLQRVFGFIQVFCIFAVLSLICHLLCFLALQRISVCATAFCIFTVHSVFAVGFCIFRADWALTLTRVEKYKFLHVKILSLIQSLIRCTVETASQQGNTMMWTGQQWRAHTITSKINLIACGLGWNKGSAWGRKVNAM